jgi:DNA-binding ferritin-like protein
MYSYKDLVSECASVLKNEEFGEEKPMINTLIAEEVQDLMVLQKQAHIWHLQTGSFAEHEALGGFYDGLGGCIDGLAELLMGINGKFSVSAKSFSFSDYTKYDAIKKLEDELQKLNNLFKMTSDNAVLNGKIGGISELFAKTLYKLKELN